MEHRPIEPVSLTGLDGTQYDFLLSMGAIRRLKKRFSVTSLQSLMEKDAEEAGLGILWEALLNKAEGLTEEKFVDNLPAHFELVMKTCGKLLGASFPDAPANPMIASPQDQIQ